MATCRKTRNRFAVATTPCNLLPCPHWFRFPEKFCKGAWPRTDFMIVNPSCADRAEYSPRSRSGGGGSLFMHLTCGGTKTRAAQVLTSAEMIARGELSLATDSELWVHPNQALGCAERPCANDERGTQKERGRFWFSRKTGSLPLGHSRFRATPLLRPSALNFTG